MLKIMLLATALTLAVSPLQAQGVGDVVRAMVFCLEEDDALVLASKGVNDGDKAVMDYLTEDDNSCVLIPQPMSVKIVREVRKLSGKSGMVTVFEVVNEAGAKAFGFKKENLNGA